MLARLDAYMEAAGIDAVVSWRPVTVAWLTGYSRWMSELGREFMFVPGGSGELLLATIALAPRGVSPALVVEPVWALDARDMGIADLRVAEDGDLVAALAAAMRDAGIADGRIGVDLDGMDARAADRLRTLLPDVEWRDCSTLLRVVRAVKTPAQVDRLRASARIGEEAAAGVLRAAGADTSLADLAAGFRRAVTAAGAAYDHFAAAPAGLGFTTTGSRPLGAGGVTYVDWGCVLDGWYCDAGTTLAVGQPDAAAREDHRAAFECVAAGAADLRPGVLGSEVQARMRAALGSSELMPHGHGLGLEVREYPFLAPAAGERIADGCVDLPADLPLEEGMVVNLEAPVLTAGVRSVHCEQTFVITGSGSEPLLDQPRADPIIASGRPSPS